MTETSQPETTQVPTCLPTQGPSPDYAILYGGEPARLLEGGGDARSAYAEAEVQDLRVFVSYSMEGLQGVEVFSPEDPDDITKYEPEAEQPDRGSSWVPESGDGELIQILPETEVDSL